MDIPALAVGIGSGLAAFGAAWIKLNRELQKQPQSAMSSKEIEKLRAKVAQLEAARDHESQAITRLEDALRRAQERLERAVTDEEFATYSAATTSTLHNLTEKVGHVAGAVEAWYRGAGRGGE